MPDKEPRESISISLPKPLAKQLREEAEKRVVGVGLIAEQALTWYLRTLPPIHVPPNPQTDSPSS